MLRFRNKENKIVGTIDDEGKIAGITVKEKKSDGNKCTDTELPGEGDTKVVEGPDTAGAE